MPYYEDDASLQEVHDELYRHEEERVKKQSGISKLSDKARMWISLFVGGIAVLLLFDKITFQKALMLGAIGSLILYLLFGMQTERKELTWMECMIRLQDLLDFVQKHPIGDHEQIPRGKIMVQPIGKKQFYDGKPWKRSFAVDIYDADLDLTEMYFAEVDIYTGDIITLRRAPEGVIGDEKKDIRPMPSQDMMMQKKKYEYLGKAGRQQGGAGRM